MAAAGLTHTWRQALAIRLAWPVSQATLERLLSGQSAALEADPSLAALLTILRADNPLGDFGSYQAVAELAPGSTITSVAGAATAGAVIAVTVKRPNRPTDPRSPRHDRRYCATLPGIGPP